MRPNDARAGPGRVARPLALVACALILLPPALAAEYRAVGEPAAVLYDAPSARSKPLFVLGRETPLEVIVPVEGWVKVRDAAGTIGWVESKALSERRSLVVRTPLADVRANPDDTAPVIFRAEAGVLLELAEPLTSPANAVAPGWIKVRHRDGQAGFVRISQVFGL